MAVTEGGNPAAGPREALTAEAEQPQSTWPRPSQPRRPQYLRGPAPSRRAEKKPATRGLGSREGRSLSWTARAAARPLPAGAKRERARLREARPRPLSLFLLPLSFAPAPDCSLGTHALEGADFSGNGSGGDVVTHAPPRGGLDCPPLTFSIVLGGV